MEYMITARNFRGRCTARSFAPTRQKAFALYNAMQPDDRGTVAIWKGSYGPGSLISIGREELIDCKTNFAIFAPARS